MKKLLAIMLCVCLLLPAMSITAVQSVQASGDYYLASTGYRVNVSGTTGPNGGFNINAASSFDAIDLTAFGYPTDGTIIAPGKLGLQMDVYANGDPKIKDSVTGYNYSSNGGQIELTSSGTCDKNEYMTWATALSSSYGEWTRVIIDMSKFNIVTGGAMDVKKWCYIRIYATNSLVPANCAYEFKICNVRLVNLEAEPPSLESDPLGDGTFEVEPPVWHEVDIPDGFNNDEKIVAGYNLKEYIEAHSDVVEVQQCLKSEDYAPIIQSLCNGLKTAGGGALYIPSGTYPCRTEIVMPSGVIIYGDWKNPDESPKTEGTILAVYAGKGSVGGAPFIKMSGNNLVRYLNFWYPEQGYTNDTVVPYPVTVSLAGYSWAQDVTFVNSYTALRHGPNYANCPNVQDVYGTAMFLGMDMDFAIDIARIENANFSPKYWEQSGLPGTPTTDAEKTSLRNFLRFNATGMNVARIDWSYITFVNVEGYSAGMVFNSTETGSANGQCQRLHFKDCRVGLSVIAIGVTGEMVSHSVFENCDYGVWLTERDVNSASGGILHLINAEIDATEYAIYQQQGTMVQLLSSTIKNGVVGSTYGWYNMVNSTFETEAPQVVLESGTVSAVIVGCKDADGNDIVVENEGFCPVTFDSEPAEVAEIATYEDEEIRKQDRRVESDKLYLVQNVANDGKTDVTAALQTRLNKAAEEGGGIVFLANGRYLVNGTLTIPTGVELRGPADYGNICSSAGAIICVTRTTALSDPTVIMKEGSGMRGIIFHYPDQAHNDLFSKNNRFTTYPYAIQGQGKDIYIINVGMHNVWNGVDLMTYQCDNHYVDYLGGQALNNMIQVGGGSKNGIVRNLHTNPNAINTDFEGLGFAASFETLYYRQTQNNTVIIRVGHAEDQLVYNCFNYSGFAGIQVEAEESGKATIRAVGNATDYGTRAYNILDCEKIDILNAQMCIFSRIGSSLKHELIHINLGADNTGVVNATGVLFWEQSARWLNVEGGTLNIYGTNEHANVTTLANVSNDAYLNIVAIYVKHGGLRLPTQNGDRVSINSGYYTSDLLNSEYVNYKNVVPRSAWWSYPADRLDLPVGTNVLFTESFDSGYAFQSMSQGAVSGSSVSAQSGRLMVDLGTGRSAGATAMVKGMVADTPDSIFTVELRLNVSQLSQDGQFSMSITTSTGDVINPFIVSEAGFAAVDAYGESEVIAGFVSDARTFYRVRLEFDLREENAKTYKVMLLDDKENLLAQSQAYAMPDDMQAEGGVIDTVYVGALDLTAEYEAEAATKAAVDYLIVYENSGTLGDVNDDGKIDSTDARMTLQYFVGSLGEGDLNLATADVSGDGNVDSTDARLILQYFVGTIDEFPAA